jgi:uncharacterized protein (DUF2141 family)
MNTTTPTALRSTLAIAGLALLCAALQPAAQAQTAATATATTPAAGCASVEVHNVRPQQGQLMVAAYGDAETFGKRPMVSLRVPAGETTTTVQLCGLTGTVVALTLFQDLDSDGKMGRNVLGMPTEPWGSSGSPGAFGPGWESAKVALDGKPLIVRMSQ